MRNKVLFVFGTRPEAIKMAPVIRQAQNEASLDVKVCVTGQHREILNQVLETFQIRPDHNLDTMVERQTLLSSTTRILTGLENVLAKESPDMVVVQGDTTTTLCGAMAAFYSRIPVAHLEAGLRTGDMAEPFPEEANRVLTTRLTSLHFAATSEAANNLRRDGVASERIFVVGNSGIDSVLYVASELQHGRMRSSAQQPEVSQTKRMIAVTAHRRESFGKPLEQLCAALQRLSDRPDVEIVYPVHPNPNVRGTVNRLLSQSPNIQLIEPLDYVSFVDLLQKSYFVITDSGGVQEEAPSLGKPILVVRDKTERPEAVHAGTARLVGTNPNVICEEATRLLDDSEEYSRRSRIHNPYGDGFASPKIIGQIIRFLEEKHEWTSGCPQFAPPVLHRLVA